MNRILDALEERERDVLKLYFGLGVETTHTLDEIGSQLNLSGRGCGRLRKRPFTA